MKIRPADWLKVARESAGTQVDGASIAAFRVAFGLLGILVVVRFFAHGWIGPLYVEPDHHFTYLGFGWVKPWPGWGMYAHFIALGALSLGIAAGYRTRLCAALFCIGFTYVELLDRTTYLNHYYLMSLTSLLLAILPTRRETVPLWTIWTLRAQIGVVYVFAGVAKLNPDWLFHALSMRIWLYQQGDLPLLGQLLQETWMAYVMSWGGVLFDLAIVPALLWRRTRLPAYCTLVAFHLATWVLFPQLGVFPWLMIGLSLVFFDPDWPRRLIACYPRRFPISIRHPRFPLCHSSLPIPSFRLSPESRTPPQHDSLDSSSYGGSGNDELRGQDNEARHSWLSRALVAALVIFAAVQLALPLRHFAYPGNVRWTEEGYLFAWRVMLTEKVGYVRYQVSAPDTGQSWLVEPHDYLTPLQVERMSFQPDMIQQTARIIAEDFTGRGYPDPVVNADAFVAFNGRPNARLIDPGVDLASVQPGLAPKAWVLPYEPDAATAGNQTGSAR